MTLDGFLGQAFVYLTAAVVAVPIARRFGLGSVLGYLIAGILIGPWSFGLVGTEGQDVMHFAEFGVVMMLFVIGLELEPSLLWRMRGPILGLGGTQVVATSAAVAGIGMGFGLGWNVALTVGMGLSLSSTAIVLQTLNEKGLMKTRAGEGSFSVLLFQDIAVIPMLAFMPLLALGAVAQGADHGGEAGHETVTWIAGQPPLLQTMIVLAAVTGLILGGRFILPPFFRYLGRARMREVFTAATLLLVIGIALLMSRVGLSPALGAFLAGVVLANSEYKHELEANIEPFKGLLLGLFFIAVGASIDFGLIIGNPGLISALVVGILAIKWLVLVLLGRRSGMSLDQTMLFAFALPQAGEFAFVLFSFAEQEAVLDHSVVAPLVAAVALTMALTPLLMIFNERLIQPRFGTKVADDSEPDTIDEHGSVLIAGFGGFGSTVGRLLKGQGVATTVLEFDSERVELLRRLGLKVFYGDATRLDLLELGGAQEAKLLVVALDSPETTIAVVEKARQHFPHLRVVARAFDWADAHELLDAGAHRVYRESLDTSLRAGADVLRDLGYRAYPSYRAAQKFMHHEEESLQALHRVREGDRSSYLSAARHRIEDLEEMLLSDMGEADVLLRDSGWDPASVREEFGGGPPT